MNANVLKLLNEQVNKEFYSAYLYLDFANYYASVGLAGFENWYKVQAQEEKSASDLITKMALFGGDGKGPYMLNSELKSRVYAAPSLVL